jgi:hypothetical protein
MLVFLKNAQEIMYMFEVELLLKEKIGKDLKTSCDRTQNRSFG